LVEILPRGRSEAGALPANAAPEKIVAQVARLQAEFGIDEKEALKRLARELGRSKSEVYRELQRERARLR
jgi:16S rRNA (cytidine1402-2'-O)-methyltransferase